MCNMRTLFILSTLVSFAMLCSCQKQDSTAAQQLTQRKAELDDREKALDEREKTLDQRERALSVKEKFAQAIRPVGTPQTAPAEPQRTVPPELQGLIPDPGQAKAERDARMQERLAERQRRMEEIQRRRMSHAVPARAAEIPSPTPSPSPP
jgi:hypothetical protein